MDRRRFALALTGLAALAPSRARPVGATGEVTSEALVTAPLRIEGRDASLSLTRVVYGSGGQREVEARGPLALYVEEGILAVNLGGDPPALLYSGPELNPPRPEVGPDGATLVGPGYAVFSEGPGPILTSNGGADPLSVLAMSLAWEDGAGTSSGNEERAVPTGS